MLPTTALQRAHKRHLGSFLLLPPVRFNTYIIVAIFASQFTLWNGGRICIERHSRSPVRRTQGNEHLLFRLVQFSCKLS
jgi:hypothetical protein